MEAPRGDVAHTVKRPATQGKMLPACGGEAAWLRLSMGCVAWDGVVDWGALVAVEFAYNFVATRAFLKAHGDLSGYINVDGARVANPHADGSFGARWFYVALSGRVRGAWEMHTDGGAHRIIASGRSAAEIDDVPVALLALCAVSPAFCLNPAPAGDVCLDLEGTWLARMSITLASRSDPWTPPEYEREIALARALYAMTRSRFPGVDVSCHGDPVGDVDQPRFDGACLPGAARLLHAHADARCVWTREGLTVHCNHPQPSRRTRPWDPAVVALRAFLSFADRLYAAPPVYVGVIAPALAAQIQSVYRDRVPSADNDVDDKCENGSDRDRARDPSAP